MVDDLMMDMWRLNDDGDGGGGDGDGGVQGWWMIG
jgi:hypothetical protein